MKSLNSFLSLLLLLPVIFVSSCTKPDVGVLENPGVIADTPEQTAQEQTAQAPSPTDIDANFSYSYLLNDDGFWEGVTALDYYDGFDFDKIVVPADVHNISDEDLQYEINRIVESYPGIEITDREVKDGDTLNIDFVGSIDGVPFVGGDTQGAGEEVTIGVTSYIDDFLQQLIGHKPGETINVEVTFPDDYHEESLRGKDALFVTEINYISESPPFDMDFINENMPQYNWKTVEEANEVIRRDIMEKSMRQYLTYYADDDETVLSIPPNILKYQEQSMLNFYNVYAEQEGMTLDEFLKENIGYENAAELIESTREMNESTAKSNLLIQAIAEYAGIKVTDNDMSEYFLLYSGTDDYSDYERQYGLPYLKQIVLDSMVVKYVIDNATLG